jgi:hypothetical protein
VSREGGKPHLWIVAGIIYHLTGRLLDARLVGRAAGIGFTQKLKRKANEDEIPRCKKQLRSCFAVLEGADRGWESRNRGRWSDLYLSGGWAISLKMSRSVWVEALQRCVLYLALRRSYERERNLEKQAVRLGRLSRIESLIPHATPDAEQ